MICPPGGYSEYGDPTKCRKWASNHWSYKDKVNFDVYGWVTHAYPGNNWDTAGQAIWNNGCEIPAVDLCCNVAGDQTTLPTGYVDPEQDKTCSCDTGYEASYGDDENLICTPIQEEKDLCENDDLFPGNQTTIPDGYEDPDQDGICTLIEEEEDGADVCPNIKGDQAEVPNGYYIATTTKECIAYTHGGPDEPEIQPQVLAATTDTESLPVGGGEWLFLQSMLAAFGALIASALIGKLVPKTR